MRTHGVRIREDNNRLAFNCDSSICLHLLILIYNCGICVCVCNDEPTCGSGVYLHVHIMCIDVYNDIIHGTRGII